MIYTDVNKNVVTKEGQDIFLFLPALGERRKIGTIIGDALLIERPDALEHWMRIYESWAVNFGLIRHCNIFGFKRVWFVGVDGSGKQWNFKRSCADILRWGYIFGYKTVGMEVQITIQPNEGPFKQSWKTEAQSVRNKNNPS